MRVYPARINRKGSPIRNRLLELAAKRGISVIKGILTEEIDGFYYYSGRKENICLNAQIRGSKEIMVLAHELGHATLHKGKTEKALYFSGKINKDKAEEQADAFARRLIRMLGGGGNHGNS